MGKIIVLLEAKGENFKGLTLDMMKKVNPIFDESALKCLDITTSLSRKKTFGSTNQKEVQKRITFWKKVLLKK